MGWLSFFSKKPPADNLGDGLRAQAYDATVAATPPIRGTYPVAGNGPNILDKFQKSHPHLRAAHFNDDSAPPPIVPRLFDRPNTAPTQRSPEGCARPESRTGASPKPPRQPPKKRYGPYKLPSKISTEQNEDVAASRSIYSLPSPPLTRDRNSSIFSGDSGSTRRFVDLLDAQSFIKPSDFYGRVRATGTKDYDEDVADRNIDEKGSSLHSMQDQDFYPRNSTPSVHGYDNRVDRPRSSKKRYSAGSGLPTKSSNSHLNDLLPMIISSETPKEDGDKSEAVLSKKASRRRSLHSYVPSSSMDRPKSASKGKRVKGVSSDYFPDSLRERARAAVLEDFGQDLSVGLDVEGNSRRSIRTRKVSVREQDLEDSDSDDSFNAPIDFKQALPRANRYQSPKGPSRRRTMPHISSTHVRPPSKRGSLKALQSFGHGEITAEGNLPCVEESLHRKRNREPSRHHYETFPDFDGAFDEVPPLQPAALLKSKAALGRPSGKDELNYNYLNGSIVSVSGKSTKRSEITEIVPERGSSIRRCSLTSETAGSTLSSNPFRPQSGHTTNTSVDLTPRKSLPKTVGSSQASFLPEDHIGVDPEMLAGSLLNSSKQRPSIDFVIDEDASSVDSFDAPRRSAGEFEKDLLFQGYGLEGSQLPGLPASFDAAATKTNKLGRSPPAQTISVPNSSRYLAASTSNLGDGLSSTFGSQYSTRSLKQLSRSRSSHLQVPSFDDSDSDNNEGLGPESDSEDEMNFDIPLTRSTEPRYHSLDSRRRFETAARPSREHILEFADAATLAQLRREAKAMERASSASMRKSKGKGKAPDIRIPRIELDDDQSGYADSE